MRVRPITLDAAFCVPSRNTEGQQPSWWHPGFTDWSCEDFGPPFGGAVALKMTHEGRAGACVLLSSFASLPLMARAVFPFVPAPELLVKDPFDCAALAPAVDRPVLVLHGTRDEIVPFSQGETVARLLPKATFVPIPHAGHNDTFNGAAFRLVLDSLDAFLKKL